MKNARKPRPKGRVGGVLLRNKRAPCQECTKQDEPCPRPNKRREGYEKSPPSSPIIPLYQLRSMYRLRFLHLVPRLVPNSSQGCVCRQRFALPIARCQDSRADSLPTASETYRYPLMVRAPQTSIAPCTSRVPFTLSFPNILTLSSHNALPLTLTFPKDLSLPLFGHPGLALPVPAGSYGDHNAPARQIPIHIDVAVCLYPVLYDEVTCEGDSPH